MSTFELFGNEISFKESEDRYFKLIYHYSISLIYIKKEFDNWYKNCSGILEVLNGYKNFSGNIMKNYGVDVLFKQLAEIDVYDISEVSYRNECIDCTPIHEIHKEISDMIKAIDEQRLMEIAYRQSRKDSRTRVQGIGVGLGGFAKATAQAGAINMVTGALHGATNAAGNARSNHDAAKRKRELYNSPNTYEELFSAINDSLWNLISNHIDFIEDIKSGYFDNSFDVEKCTALFNSAKMYKEKRIKLLIEAFIRCPWDDDLLDYIFETYPDERKNIMNIANWYEVDLTETTEKLLSGFYTVDCKESEELALEARKFIVETMEEYNIKDSYTLDRLEADCILRLVDQYKNANFDDSFGVAEHLFSLSVRDEGKIEAIKSAYIWQLAPKYDINFTDKEKENILDSIYDKTPRRTLEDFQVLKERAKKAMEALSMESSDIFDNAEVNIAIKMCQKYTASGYSEYENLQTELENSDLQRKNIAKAIADLHIWQLAPEYEVVFTDYDLSIILGKEYSHEARSNDKLAFEARERVLKIMNHLNITESKTLDDIEGDCLKRLVTGYDDSDEQTCNEFIEKIKSFNATEKNKELFINKINSRIEEIWSSEDNLVFDELIMNTDIHNQEPINKTLETIKAQSRTSAISKWNRK